MWFVLAMSITHVAIAAATVVTEPAAPSPSDVVTVNYQIESFNGPLTVSVTLSASDVTVLVSLFVGDFSVPGGYGVRRTIPALPAGQYTLRLYVRQGHDYMQYGPPVLAKTSTFTVTPSQPPTVEVIEFHHSALNHYFITADPGEIASLDGNTQSLGWIRTGRRFMAYPSATELSSASPVCRFYGSVSPGPNSHFYTGFLDECNFLKALQQSTPQTQPCWNFEATAFSTVTPTQGLCPVLAPVPVFRLYNNRAMYNDSNHRYLTDVAIYESMQQQGWIGEGVAMCSKCEAR